MSLTREQILAHADTRWKVVLVPLLDGDVHIGRLSVEEVDRLGRAGENGKPAVAEVIMLGARTPTGQRLFSEGDLDALAALPADAVAPLANAILRFNGIGSDAPAADDKATPKPKPAKASAKAASGAAAAGGAAKNP